MQMKNRAINNWTPILNKDAKKAAVVKCMKVPLQNSPRKFTSQVRSTLNN